LATLELSNVKKSYGKVDVIHGIDLHIDSGDFCVFVGPSGCGKSTLLRMIAGLEPITNGEVSIEGNVVNHITAAKRGLAMVFQSYALYPHMSVKDNMGFSLKTAGASQQEINEKVNAVAQTLKLEAYLHRRPKELSGGQRQRVAIGRSIVREPTAFLFDEPLSNLDAALRVEMRYEISKLHQSLAATMVYVTHDQVEAMTLADRIVVLDAGKIIQVGTPKELYNHPANVFVAQFIGSPKMNIVPCSVDGTQYHLPGARGGACDAQHQQAQQLGIRAEHINIVAQGQAQCDGRVEVVEYLGADTFILLDCEQLGQLSVRVSGESNLQLNSVVGLQFDAAHTHFFDADDQSTYS